MRAKLGLTLSDPATAFEAGVEADRDEHHQRELERVAERPKQLGQVVECGPELPSRWRATSRTERSIISARDPTRASGGMRSRKARRAEQRKTGGAGEQERTGRDEHRRHLAWAILSSYSRAEPCVDSLGLVGALRVERLA